MYVYGQKPIECVAKVQLNVQLTYLTEIITIDYSVHD